MTWFYRFLKWAGAIVTATGLVIWMPEIAVGMIVVPVVAIHVAWEGHEDRLKFDFRNERPVFQAERRERSGRAAWSEAGPAHGEP